MREVDPVIFGAMEATRPDVVLFLGDNIYLPHLPMDPSRVVGPLYDRVLHHPAMKRIQAVAQVFAGWDDHDYGSNNADSRYPFRAVTLEYFRRAWRGNPAPPQELSEGVAFSHRIGQVLLVMADDRSYRVNGTAGTMFGEKQLQWMERTIRSTDAKIVVLGNGNQLLPRFGRDESLSNFPVEYDRFRRFLAELTIPVVILSGDRHFAELYKVPLGRGTVLEATSSPLHNSLATENFVAAEPDRVGLYRGGTNFGLLDIRIEDALVEVSLGIASREGSRVVSAHHTFGGDPS
jgi:alkaline phosphatase D